MFLLVVGDARAMQTAGVADDACRHVAGHVGRRARQLAANLTSLPVLHTGGTSTSTSTAAATTAWSYREVLGWMQRFDAA